MSKPVKSKKTTPAKPKGEKVEEKKKTGKVTQIDELELEKIVGGMSRMGYAEPANN